MKYFIQIFYNLSLVSGLIAFVLMLVLYLMNHNRLLKLYLIFSSFLLIYYFITDVFTFLKQISQSLNLSTDIMITVIYLGWVCLFFYFAPLLFHELTGTGFRTQRIVFIFVPCAFVLAILISILLSKPENIYSVYRVYIDLISYLLFLGVVLYCSLIVFLNLNNENLDFIIQKNLFLFFTTLLIFIPLLILDLLLINRIIKWNIYNSGFRFSILVYLTWNILIFIKVIQYLRNNTHLSNIPQITDINGFKKKFEISEREWEVILLLTSGESYRDIGDKLFISINTVKTHIFNAYQKTGANSKKVLKEMMKKHGL